MLHKTIFYTMAALFFLIPAASGFTGAPAADRSSGPGPEQKQIRAFIYHHFGMEDQYPSTSVSVNQFKNHLDYLDRQDYTVLTLGRALDRLCSKKGISEKTAVISIDDGYGSVWDNALPLLEKYGYPTTIFT
ncbi:MAG: polysaccharide deacetylase family protein, partial [Desulfobacterales bacterium]|nr:polysaccharide deacetylase family protein [Desulfobacterales bacterium]